LFVIGVDMKGGSISLPCFQKAWKVTKDAGPPYNPCTACGAIPGETRQCSVYPYPLSFKDVRGNASFIMDCPNFQMSQERD
jgi:hypothetical protein